MSCPNPLAWDTLVAYWAEDLAEPDVARVDEHVMACERCAEESARLAGLVEAIRGYVPPVVAPEQLAALRRRGLSILETVFQAGEPRTVGFTPGVDLLIHRLAPDGERGERVEVTIRDADTGRVLAEEPDAPLDADGAVLIACQRHYAAVSRNTIFEVRRVGNASDRSATYSVHHRY